MMLCHLRIILQHHPIFHPHPSSLEVRPIHQDALVAKVTSIIQQHTAVQLCSSNIYTTSIRCPCLLAGHPCTSVCACHNCANLNGIRPNISNRVREQRKKHAWNLKSTNSILYAHQEQKNILPGPRTQLKYLLVSQILTFSR